MIFITVGTQNFNLNRLLIEIDKLIINENIIEEVYAQVGASDYKPLNYNYEKFISSDEMNSKLDKADIVITHGGTSSIVKALKYKKKIIIVPRNSELKEHVDNHQKEIAEFYARQGYAEVCNDITKLNDLIIKVRKSDYKLYLQSDDRLKKDIICFIKQTIN